MSGSRRGVHSLPSWDCSVPAAGADFEVNANGGPRMATAIHLDPDAESGFWYVLDRAIAHRSGVTISGPHPSLGVR